MPTNKHVPPTNEELERWETITEDECGRLPRAVSGRLIAEVRRLRGVCEQEARNVCYELPSADSQLRAWAKEISDRLRAAAEGK